MLKSEKVFYYKIYGYRDFFSLRPMTMYYRIGNLPIFSKSENNESSLLLYHWEEMHLIQYIGTYKSVYTNGYALNFTLKYKKLT